MACGVIFGVDTWRLGASGARDAVEDNTGVPCACDAKLAAKGDLDDDN
jgi:hypothetical protein